MLSFSCDYNEGAHAKVLEKLIETNLIQVPGYGEDKFCESAKKKIKEACQCPQAEVFFLVGGTQTNMIVIDTMLAKYEGVISAVTGHINGHEAGAVEFTGHKVLPLPSADGRITADQVEAYCAGHWGDATHEHMVQPGMVYISQPTENGTLYTLEQLTALRKVCDKYDLMLYVDGARCGYGLASPVNDVFLPDLARLCDVFYIGGTKVGAMFGEAVVIMNEKLNKDFRYYIKRQGGMLAKGRLLGVQFETLMENGLYQQLGQHAVSLALEIRKTFEECGVSLLYDSPTNQQFPILPDTVLHALSEAYAYSYWERVDDTHSAVRFCTGWATRDEDIDALIADLRALCKE
jgi:threonine aldolase